MYSSSSLSFLVSYLNLNASCLSWMKLIQHHSGRHSFTRQLIWCLNCLSISSLT